VGYIPFEPEAANLFFQLVSSRYERASLIVTSNKVFGRWGEVFGDDVVAAVLLGSALGLQDSQVAARVGCAGSVLLAFVSQPSLTLHGRGVLGATHRVADGRPRGLDRR
jgi:hypothetical protein